MHAQPGKNAGDRGRFHGRAAEFGLDRRERQGAASGALPQARRTGSRDPARPRRFDGARLACHNKDVHRRLTPPAPAARAVFDAIEQARVEAIGSRRMLGVAGNLDAMLDDRFQRARYADIAVRAEAPLEDALAMIVRERLTGLKPPKNAQRIVDLWRPWVEDTRRRRSRQAWAGDRGSAGLRVCRPQAVDGARND